MQEIIEKYFPHLLPSQKEKFLLLPSLYREWNSRINVISRKDMEYFGIHHVLHSLAIQRIVSFAGGSKVLDAGTGGGFPGIPLAILFPETGFTLLDSIGKKIKVVTTIASELDLKNVTPVRARAEDLDEQFDFVISRAVAPFPDFVKLTLQNIRKGGASSLPNGIICLKGGDLTIELKQYRTRVKIWKIRQFFTEPFFETKQIVYLPA